MDPTAIVLVLIAAVAHAGWNLAAKFVRGNGPLFVWWYSVVGVVVCIPPAVYTLVTEHQRPQWTWLFAAAVSAVLHVAYNLVLQKGYAAGDLSVVYPLARGTGPLLSVIFAIVLFGERPGVFALIGASAVVIGVLVISFGRGPASSPRGVSIGYGVLTGASIAGYTLWDGHAMNTIGVPPTVYFGLSVLGNSVLLAPTALRGKGKPERTTVGELWRRHRKQILIVGVLSPVAYLLVLYAMRIAPISLVAPARESSIVLGSLAGWLILREPNPVRRLIGSAIALAGITALALS